MYLNHVRFTDVNMPVVKGNRFPRGARRARKPRQPDWVKVPKGEWLECTYPRCGHQWQYFGGRSWAECPVCHTTIKVSAGRRAYRSSPQRESFRRLP
jgi:hypothetical protein